MARAKPLVKTGQRLSRPNFPALLMAGVGMGGEFVAPPAAREAREARLIAVGS
jgi:hypothetical protein